MQTNRYADAEREVRQVLAQEPNHPEALQLLALCYQHQDKLADAEDAIKRAITADAGDDQAYYIYAAILHQRDRQAEAARMISSAISMHPYNADYFGLQAYIFLADKKFEQALEKANEGLALDAANLNCLNARTTALTKLNRKEEAYNTIRYSLEENPENAYTHANVGWSLLEQGQHAKALEHFRESLRLNPQNDFAKAGMVQAMKAKYWVYRQFLNFQFWLGRMKGGVQWAVIIGIYLLSRVLGRLSDAHPFFLVLYVALIAFALSTWIIGPVSNLFLRLNVYGRYALNRDEIISSNAAGISLALALLGVLAYFVTDMPQLLLMAGISFTMMIPLSSMLSPSSPGNKKILIGYAIAMGVVGIVAIVLSFTGSEVFNAWTVAYLVGFMIYQWVANGLVIR
jgi:tetratricopeptide (TPR) repeat protein